jgi:hypothetical protein
MDLMDLMDIADHLVRSVHTVHSVHPVHSPSQRQHAAAVALTPHPLEHGLLLPFMAAFDNNLIDLRHFAALRLGACRALRHAWLDACWNISTFFHAVAPLAWWWLEAQRAVS